MKKLLNFIDHLCLDDQLYWRVALRDGTGDAEVRWQRDLRPDPWTVRLRDGAYERETTSAALAAELTAAGVDLADFERQVGASILTQAVFAEMVREGAVEIFGEDAVARSYADTQAFLAGVSEATSRLGAAAIPPKTARLRVVRN